MSVPMTAEGAEALRAELAHRKGELRQKITQDIAEARGHGDLKENAEYHAAREQQGFIEGRIMEIEAKLSNAQIIDVTKIANQGKVIFGATVHLTNMETEEAVVYRIVGQDEADLNKGLLSISSPVARALIGKEEGEDVEVNAPSGAIAYEISAVEYI